MTLLSTVSEKKTRSKLVFGSVILKVSTQSLQCCGQFLSLFHSLEDIFTYDSEKSNISSWGLFIIICCLQCGPGIPLGASGSYDANGQMCIQKVAN